MKMKLNGLEIDVRIVDDDKPYVVDKVTKERISVEGSDAYLIPTPSYDPKSKFDVDNVTSAIVVFRKNGDFGILCKTTDDE